jgi:hypothetical protein
MTARYAPSIRMAMHAMPCMAISLFEASISDDILALYQLQYTLFLTIIDYSPI